MRPFDDGEVELLRNLDRDATRIRLLCYAREHGFFLGRFEHYKVESTTS